jgi:hypothetical protein
VPLLMRPTRQFHLPHKVLSPALTVRFLCAETKPVRNKASVPDQRRVEKGILKSGVSLLTRKFMRRNVGSHHGRRHCPEVLKVRLASDMRSPRRAVHFHTIRERFEGEEEEW